MNTRDATTAQRELSHYVGGKRVQGTSGRFGDVFNPTLGEYDVMSDVGPSYLTQRQQAFAAFQQIVAHNPALTSVIGDLMFKAADFPMSDHHRLSGRLRRSPLVELSHPRHRWNSKSVMSTSGD